ncbi:hypothetical protein BH09VER1_BH09VER1_37730 [soil metagenome]
MGFKIRTPHASLPTETLSPMKPKYLLSILLAVASVALPLRAQEAKPVRGIVTTVVGTSVTIAANKDGEMAYATTPQTKILKLDGTVGSLADLTPGATVKVSIAANANTATEIQIVPAKKP